MAVTAPTFSATGACAVSETIYAKLATQDEDAFQDINSATPVDYSVIGFTNANANL